MNFVVLIITLLISASAVTSNEAETMTENLLRAQGELSWTHKFVESQFLSHRDLINPTLEEIQKFSIDLFLDSVETVREVAEETRQKMAEFGSSLCANASRDSWDRRVISYGNTLNFCASEATRVLNDEYSDLTYFDKDGSRVSNHVQNQGFHILAQNDIFETRGDYYTLINRRLRDLLLRAGPWVAIMDELLELMDHHIELAYHIVTMCNTVYTERFNRVAEEALEGIRSCTAD